MYLLEGAKVKLNKHAAKKKLSIKMSLRYIVVSVRYSQEISIGMVLINDLTLIEPRPIKMFIVQYR